MKYYIYILALCLLLMLTMAASPALASDSSADMPVTSSFQISSVAEATDNVSGVFSPGPGKIDITRGDHVIYIQVLTSTRGAGRLASLNDYESGIVFRNNTMLLPVCPTGVRTGTLIVATDNLNVDSNGYAGTVTGLELDSEKITTVRNGMNFSASSVISLNDLPAGGTYSIAFKNNTSLSDAVSSDLESSGLSGAALSPPLDVSASTLTAENMVGFVIVTLETEESPTGSYDDSNVTFYRLAGGELSRLRFTITRSGEGGIAYQAISPGTGQFMIVATTPRDIVDEPVTDRSSDIILIGSLLAALLIALAIMVRRVTKR